MRQIHDTNLVFIHIPKNAGQAVTDSFGCEHLSADHTLESEQDRRFMRAPFVRFAVVRNPIDRFVSAFKYHCHMVSMNTDIIWPRRIMNEDKTLMHDINAFIRYAVATDQNFQSDLWFKRQTLWLRKAKPQIMLRYENLKSDLEIPRQLAPQHFRGLKAVNKSKGRQKSEQANVDLSSASMEFLRRFYDRDLFYLSYDHELS